MHGVRSLQMQAFWLSNFIEQPLPGFALDTVTIILRFLSCGRLPFCRIGVVAYQYPEQTYRDYLRSPGGAYITYVQAIVADLTQHAPSAHPTRPADEEGARRNHDPRLQEQRYHHIVRRAGCAER